MINIVENTPLSIVAIGTQRTYLKDKLLTLTKKQQLIRWCTFSMVLFIVSAAITGNATFNWLPWDIFSTLWIFFIVAIAGAAFGAIVDAKLFSLAAIVAPSLAISSIAPLVLGFAFVGIFVFLVGFIFIDNRCLDAILDLKNKYEAMEFADARACLEIKNWIDVPEILAFRNAVVDQQRRFILAEVNAMRDFYNSRDKRLKDIENNIAIDDACKEVYLGGIINS